MQLVYFCFLPFEYHNIKSETMSLNAPRYASAQFFEDDDGKDRFALAASTKMTPASAQHFFEGFRYLIKQEFQEILFRVKFFSIGDDRHLLNKELWAFVKAECWTTDLDSSSGSKVFVTKSRSLYDVKNVLSELEHEIGYVSITRGGSKDQVDLDIYLGKYDFDTDNANEDQDDDNSSSESEQKSKKGRKKSKSGGDDCFFLSRI